MAKHCDPACNKPEYKETVKTYERCAVVNCAYTEVIVTETQDKDGVVTTTLTDKEGNPLPADTKFFECRDPVNAIVCQPTLEPVTLEGIDCDGNPVPVTGEPGQITSVVQAPGTVFEVKICEDDRDFELSCGVDPATGHTIQTAYKIKNGAFVLIARIDTVTGAEWTGDATTLEGCGGTKFESDPVEMCDSGVTFVRWIVKKDGEPTGTKYDTDLSGAPYTVTDESAVQQGKCEASCAKAPLGVVTSWAV